MPYRRNTTNLPDYPQSYTFPGDEDVAPADYNSAMRNSYLSKLPLVEVVWNKFGVPLSDEDLERTKRLFVAMSWLDHFIDEAPDREMALSSYAQTVTSVSECAPSLDLPAWARPELAPSVRLLADALHTLPEDEVNNIVQKALRIGEISQRKAQIESVKEYVKILIEEGALASDLAVEVISSESKDTADYRKLHEFERQAMIGATLLDGMLDLEEDNENGLAAVAPTLRNKLYMFNAGARYTPGVFKGLGITGIKAAVKVRLNHRLL